MTEVREYDQKIPQALTADQPMAPGGRAKEHLEKQDIQKTIKAKQPAFSSFYNLQGQVSHNLLFSEFCKTYL